MTHEEYIIGNDRTYSLKVSSNLKSDETMVSNAGTQSTADIFDIYDLTSNGGKVVALYDHSGLKTAEITIDGANITFTNISMLSGGTVSSVSTYGTNIVVGEENGGKLQVFYNGTDTVYDDTVKNETPVSVVYVNGSFYAIYTDNSDSIKMQLIEAPLEP